MISQNIDNIKKELHKITSNYGRNSNDINLVGVSKKKPLEMIIEAFDSGLVDIGENYVEEFSDKLLSFFSSDPESNLYFPISKSKFMFIILTLFNFTTR